MTTIDYLKLYREEKRRTSTSSSNRSSNSIIRHCENVQESSTSRTEVEQQNHNERIITDTNISCADNARTSTTDNNTANDTNLLNNIATTTSSSYPQWKGTDHARIPVLTNPTTANDDDTIINYKNQNYANSSISSFVQTDTIQYYCPNNTDGGNGDGVLPQQFINSLIDWLYELPENNNTTNNNNNTNNEKSANGKWNTLKHSKRRVALFDASKQSLVSLGLSSPSSSKGIKEEETNNHNNTTGSNNLFPSPLQDIVNWLIDNNIFTNNKIQPPPNHILINEYTDPTYGIMPHTDGPAYYSKTATISIGGPVIFHFTKRQQTLSSSSIKLPTTTTTTTTTISATEGMNENNTSGSTISKSKTKNDSFQIVLSGTPSSLIVFSDDTYDNYLHSIKEITTTTSSSNIHTNSNISLTDIGNMYAPDVDCDGDGGGGGGGGDTVQIDTDTVYLPIPNDLHVPTEYTTNNCLNTPANIPIHRYLSNMTKNRHNDDRFYRISLTFRTKK